MDKKAYLLHILSLVIFGSNGVISKFIELPSYGVVFYRTLCAAAVLVLGFLLSGKHFTFIRHKKDFCFIFISGFFEAVEWFFMYESFRHIDVGVATLITYLGPVIVIALSPLLFKETLSLRKIFAIAVVLVGVVCLNTGIHGSKDAAFGLFCAALTPFCYAAMLVFNKKTRRVTGTENAVVQQLCCFVCATAVTLFITRGHIPLPRPVVSQWALVLLLGIFNTGVACFLFFSTISRLPAQVIAISGYLEPMFAIVIAAVVLGQTPTILQICGSFMIMGGACCCILAKK